MDAETLRTEVEAIRWYHAMDLPGGVRTPGLTDAGARLEEIGLPEDLSGRTVLDVGAWDGFWSFEAERRGAERVLATDSFAWNGENWSTKEGFELARRALGSSVQDVEVDVMDLAPERVGGTWDVVLFLGVLYHLRHPLLALERVASVCGEELILETHVDLVGLRRPAAAFYERGELETDPTNWWGPNPAAVVAMLRAVGFREVTIVSRNSAPYLLGRALFRFAKRRPARQGRIVVHARR